MIYCSLGGLDEIGKNSHIFDFDDNIIVVNFGSRYSNKNEPGFECVISDIKYLLQKKRSIKAFVFTNVLDGQLNISALFYLRKMLPDVPVYMSEITYRLFFALSPSAIVIENKYSHNKIKTFSSKTNPLVISPNLKIFVYPLPSSIPGNYGIVLNWKDSESIFIATDYINEEVSFWHNKYLHHFNQISKHNIKLMISDVHNCNSEFPKTISYKILPHIKKAIETPNTNRYFCPFYLKNLSYLHELANYCLKNDYKIAFLAKNFYEVVNILINENLIESSTIGVFTNNINPPPGSTKIFVLVIERIDQLFPTLRKLLFHDKQIELKADSDLFLPLYIPKPGFELDHVNIINHLISNNIQVYQNKLENSIECHPNISQLLSIICLLAPDFALPINGRFTNMKYFNTEVEKLFPNVKTFLLKIGNFVKFDFENKNAILLPHKMSNGEIKFFGNSKCNDSQEDKIIFQERNIIGNHGVVTISFLIDPKKWKILSRVLVQGVGISLLTNNDVNVATRLSTEIKEIFEHQQSPQCSTAILKKEIHKCCPDIIWNLLEKSPKLIVTIVNKT